MPQVNEFSWFYSSILFIFISVILLFSLNFNFFNLGKFSFAKNKIFYFTILI